MAYWRGLSIRASSTARRRQHHPSIAHVLRNDDEVVSETPPSPPKLNHFLNQKRLFGNNSSRGVSGFGGFDRNRTISNAPLSSTSGFAFSRSVSTAIGGGSNKAELLSDVSGVLSDARMDAVASQVPAAMSEVVTAAADSWLPVKGLQYFIDSIHTFTGLNWWAAIVITTLVIRTAMVPLLINQLKSTSKLAQIKPQLDEYKQEMLDKGSDRVAALEFQQKTGKLFKEHGVHPLTPMKGLLIQGPVFISFFLAISNMAEKMPSFKSGGAYWFLDLTTPDSMYIFPVLAALTFLLTVESNLQEGMEGNPAAGTMKNVSRGLAVLTVPFTMSFPKAVFCYWVTSNVFSLSYGLVLKYSGLKKALGIPQLPPPSTARPQGPQPAFSLLSTLKQIAAVAQDPTSSPAEPSKVQDRSTSSSSVLSQRIKSLEKQVKGRKRNKKR